jgi:hypothetical protein
VRAPKISDYRWVFRWDEIMFDRLILDGDTKAARYEALAGHARALLAG